jgi:hypothetical protein
LERDGIDEEDGLVDKMVDGGLPPFGKMDG